MTVTIEIPDDQGEALRAHAQAHGLTLQQWLLLAANIEKYAPPTTSLQDELDPEEWVRQFRDWAESHDRNTPLLSDEAISRENLYS